MNVRKYLGKYPEIMVTGGDQSGPLWDAVFRIMVMAGIGRKMKHFIPDDEWSRPDKRLRELMCILNQSVVVCNKGVTPTGSTSWPSLTGFTEFLSLPGSVTPYTLSRWKREWGVNMHSLARAYEAEHPAHRSDDFFHSKTGVPGYRALVWKDPMPAMMVPASLLWSEVSYELRRLYTSLADSTQGDACANAQKRGVEIIIEAKLWLSANKKGSLSDLWKHLVGWMAKKRGKVESVLVETGVLSDYLRLDIETARGSQFWVVDQFLNPDTRNLWLQAYRVAIGGAGNGAKPAKLLSYLGQPIPFDITIPGKGKGTLSLLNHGFVVTDSGDNVIFQAETTQPIRSVMDIVTVFKAQKIEWVVLSGKARILPLQFLVNSFMVLPEEGSMYTADIERMLNYLKEQGVNVPLYPIIRICLSTWDVMPRELVVKLPDWFQPVMDYRGNDQLVLGVEFQRDWRAWVENAKTELAKLSKMETAQLLELLRERNNAWSIRFKDWRQVLENISKLSKEIVDKKIIQSTLKQELRGFNARVMDLEKRSGLIRKNRIAPLRGKGESISPEEKDDLAQAERDRDDLQQQAKGLRETEIAQLNEQIHELGIGIEGLAVQRGFLQDKRAAIELEAHLWKVNRVRQLWAVIKMSYTNRRPVFAWVDALDPSGQWLQNIVDTAELRLEFISPFTFDPEGTCVVAPGLEI